MDEETALDCVTEVTVSCSEKKQLQQYEPTEAYVGYTAEVPDGIDPQEVREVLSDIAQAEAKEQVMARWEEYIREDMDED